MKKILVLLVLVVGVIAVFSANIGAKNMTAETTQVQASHILVPTKEEAADLKTQIESNKITFEDAARKYSKCPSGARGGDLGYFGRGVMVKEFEDAAFSAPKDTVTDPVQTNFGWHLIKVTDKK